MIAIVQRFISPAGLHSITANSTQNPTNSLQVAHSILSEMFNRRVTENGYNLFISALNGISIGQAQACINQSNIDKLSSSTISLIRMFQAAFRPSDRNLSFLRSILGELLCINDTTPTHTPSQGITQAPISGCNDCSCPSDGISSSTISCLCQFFACLDPNDVLRPLLGFASDVSRSQCLAFVIDTTGSMVEEIATAQNIVREFIASEERIGETGCYILVPFNDVGPDTALVPERSKEILLLQVVLYLCTLLL